MPAAHAAIGPSSASRWMACTRSIQQSREHGVYRETDAAEEGSLAHEVFELNLVGALRAAGISVRRRQMEHDALLSRPEILDKYDFDRIESDVAGVVDRVMDLVRQDKDSRVWVEEKVTLGALTDAVWGTADCVIWQPNLGKLTILDLKYGRVWVDEERNSQMTIYAIGAMASLLGLRRWPKTIVTIIAQPRTDDPWREWEVDQQWLKDQFIPDLKEALRVINTPEAQYAPSDEACKYCPASATCPALLAEAHRVARGEFDNLDDIDTLIEGLRLLEPLEAFRKAVIDQATYLLTAGTPIPGWKLVVGRSQRRWTDEQAVRSALIGAGFDEAEITKQSLLGIPAIEKLIKSNKTVDNTVIQNYIVKPDGKPTLAKASDKRETAKADFNNLETE